MARPAVVALAQPFGDEVPVHGPRVVGPAVADQELAEPRSMLTSQRLELHHEHLSADAKLTGEPEQTGLACRVGTAPRLVAITQFP